MKSKGRKTHKNAAAKGGWRPEKTISNQLILQEIVLICLNPLRIEVLCKKYWQKLRNGKCHMFVKPLTLKVKSLPFNHVLIALFKIHSGGVLRLYDKSCANVEILLNLTEYSRFLFVFIYFWYPASLFLYICNIIKSVFHNRNNMSECVYNHLFVCCTVFTALTEINHQ